MKYFKNLKHRFIAINLFVLLMCFSLLTLCSFFFIKYYIFTTLQQDFLSQTKVIATEIWPHLSKQNKIEFINRWQQTNPGKNLYWYQQQQWVPEKIHQPNLINLTTQLLPLALNGQAVADVLFHGEMAAMVPVNDGLIVLTLPQLHPFPKYFFLYIMLIIICLVLLAILFLYPPTNKIIKVIHQLQKLAATVAQGQFGKTIEVNREDEIADLANSFNAMSQQLAEVEQQNHKLIAGVSHELRSPLTRIRVNAERMLLTPETTNLQRNCEAICDEVSQLDAMVSDLLQAAKMNIEPTTLQLEKIEVNEFLSQLIQRYHALSKDHSIKITFDSSIESVFINIDPPRFTQAITNLIDNAITAIHRNGVIQVKLSSSDKFTLIEIQDNGPGIESIHQTLIFVRFYRIDASRDRKTGGVGLGLTLVKQIIESHQGSIELDSQLGSGSTFRIKLPLK